MEWKGLKINIGKMKVMVTGGKSRDIIESGKYPCGCCKWRASGRYK